MSPDSIFCERLESAWLKPNQNLHCVAPESILRSSILTLILVLFLTDSPNPCSPDNVVCSHLCLLSASTNSNMSCSCPAGLELDINGLKCIEGEPASHQYIHKHTVNSHCFLYLAHYFELRLRGLTECHSWIVRVYDHMYCCLMMCYIYSREILRTWTL